MSRAHRDDLTSEEWSKVEAVKLEAIAARRYPPDILKWSEQLDLLFDPMCGVYLNRAAARVCARLHWQLVAHHTAHGLH